MYISIMCARVCVYSYFSLDHVQYVFVCVITYIRRHIYVYMEKNRVAIVIRTIDCEKC